MAIINNTRSPYNGKRKGFDLSPYILSPEQLYAMHKARVLADGGVIFDEAGCLARFEMLVANAIYQKVMLAINPMFGVKLAADGVSVLKVYGLRGDDFIAVKQQLDTPPAQELPLFDRNSRSIRVKVAAYAGGYLRSEHAQTIQHGDTNTYAISMLAMDTDPMDSVGLTAGLSLANLGLAYMRVIASPYSTGIREAWRYGTRASNFINQGSPGAAITVAREPYESYIPSAAYFDIAAGTITAFENGDEKNTAQSPTGALASLRDAGFVYVGNVMFDVKQGSGFMQSCDGFFRDFTLLTGASRRDAEVLSRIS